MSDRMAALDGRWESGRAGDRWSIRGLRRLGSDWDILGVGVLALAWLVFVAWTAAGSESWQARVCADLTHQPRGCEAVPSKKDESRIAPVVQAAS